MFLKVYSMHESSTYVETCPLDCGMRLSRHDYDNHVRFVCPRRTVACEFCANQFLGDAIEVSRFLLYCYVAYRTTEMN